MGKLAKIERDSSPWDEIDSFFRMGSRVLCIQMSRLKFEREFLTIQCRRFVFLLVPILRFDRKK